MIEKKYCLEFKNAKRVYSGGFHYAKNTELKWENCFGRLTLSHAFFFF